MAYEEIIHMTTLNNGILVLVNEMPFTQNASISLLSDIGTRHETPENNGAAHFLEHMQYTGTRKRDRRRINADIENVGGNANAETDYEFLEHTVNILGKNIDIGLEVTADICLNSIFPKIEFEMQKEVITEEIYSAIDNPSDIVGDMSYTSCFKNQSLGMPILGTEESLKKLKRKDVVDFWKNSYLYGNKILVVTGNVDHDHIFEKAHKLLKKAPHPSTKKLPPAKYVPDAVFDQRKINQLEAVISFKAESENHDDYLKMQLLSKIIGDASNSRLFQEVREKRGMVYAIESCAVGYSDIDLFQIALGTNTKKVGKVFPLIADILTKTGDQNKITEEEYISAQEQLITNYSFKMGGTGIRAEKFSRDLLYHGRPILLDEIESNIRSITMEDIDTLARKIFQTTPALAAVGPVKSIGGYEKFCARFEA